MTHHTFRFAPSPNGFLHLGHAYSAILNHDMAKASGGRFLVRIEDIDTARCKTEYETAIYEDLAWLGLEWQQPVRRQSEHFANYAQALDQLKSLGVVYPALLTRKQIDSHIALAGADWPRDPDGAPLYPGNERDTSVEIASTPNASEGLTVWRLNMRKAISLINHDITWQEYASEQHQSTSANPMLWGDVIVSRKDTPTSYHLSVVVDDALQSVTHIIRGRDLYHATSVHRVLQILLGLPEPIYHHHVLINDSNGSKLSKSAFSKSLRQLRTEGATPASIRKMLSL